MRAKKAMKPRRPTLKDKKREETRANLIAAAKRLFSEFGYDDVPVTEIAEHAGVTHSTINAHFGGKPGLLYEIIKENNEPQYKHSLEIAQQQRPALDRVSDILLSWVETDARDPRMLAIMQSYSWVWPEVTEAENAMDRARFKDLLTGLVEEAQDEKQLSKDVDPQVASRAIFAVYTWGLRSIVFEETTPQECHNRIMQQVRNLLGTGR